MFPENGSSLRLAGQLRRLRQLQILLLFTLLGHFHVRIRLRSHAGSPHPTTSLRQSGGSLSGLADHGLLFLFPGIIDFDALVLSFVFDFQGDDDHRAYGN